MIRNVNYKVPLQKTQPRKFLKNDGSMSKLFRFVTQLMVFKEKLLEHCNANKERRFTKPFK